VIQGRRGFGLLAEPAHFCGISELPGANHLERHHPLRGRLPGTVHHAHPAAGNLAEHLVVGEPLALNRRGHFGRQHPGAGRGLGVRIDGFAFHNACEPLRIKFGEVVRVVGRRRRFAPLAPVIHVELKQFL
jgi:hypothetical protein